LAGESKAILNDGRFRGNDRPATWGELRSLETRVEALEKLRIEVSELKIEIKDIIASVERQLSKSVPAAVQTALQPYIDKFNKLDRILEILIEQEVSDKLEAKRKADEEEKALKLSREREYRLKVWGTVVVILGIVGGLLTAMINSQVRGPAPPSVVPPASSR
jgi:dsDNA-specific endonuclease/ATPase MutS2